MTPRKKSEAKEAGKGRLFDFASGPLVRSSYRTGEFFMKGMIEKHRKQMETTTLNDNQDSEGELKHGN